MRTDERIVVGVSGSANSMAALRWATTEARLRAAEVWAVLAWSSPMETLASYASRHGVLSHDQQQDASAGLLTTAVGQALGAELDRSAVRGMPILVEGHAIPVLLQYAADAQLLVLGRRLRLNDFDGPALGMVARTCIAKAQCPVVAVAAAEVVDSAETCRGSAGVCA